MQTCRLFQLPEINFSINFTGMIMFYRFFAKFSIFFCFFIFLFLSLLGTLDGSSIEYIRFFESLFFSFSLWVIVFALVGNVYWVLFCCIPVALLAPIEFWQRFFIGVPTSMHFMAFAMETTWGEVVNFLLTYGKDIIYLYVPWAIIYISSLREARQLDLRWRSPSAFASAIVFAGIIFAHYLMQGSPAWIRTDDVESTFEGRLADGWSRQWEDVFPVNILIAAQRYFLEQEKLEKIQKSLRGKILNSRLENEVSAPEIVVLVIGESSVSTRWSIFGYSRLTNPKLESTSNIIGFNNVVSVSLATRSAVPGAISRQPILLPTGHINQNAEPSIVQIYKEAGYETYWISNQAPFGKFDSSIAVHAREADFVHFLNPSSYQSGSSLDEILLRPLQNLIEKPGRKFLVLHTLGSHFDYSLRYPGDFNKFSADKNNSSNEKISNNYDNSILYTDYFLSEVINRVRSQDRSAVVAYFSDHGEDLPGGVCEYNGVNRKTIFSYKVPVVFWLSDKYKSQHFDVHNLLLRHSSEPYTTRAISSALMTLGGIRVDQERVGEESFFVKPDLLKSPRMVALSEAMIDFDAVNFKNPCYMSSR